MPCLQKECGRIVGLDWNIGSFWQVRIYTVHGFNGGGLLHELRRKQTVVTSHIQHFAKHVRKANGRHFGVALVEPTQAVFCSRREESSNDESSFHGHGKRFASKL